VIYTCEEAEREYLAWAENNTPEGEEDARKLGAIFKSTVADKKHAQRICAVNVFHLISSFAYDVASFLPFSAANCGETKSYSAARAGGIINVITSQTIVSASAMDFENSCAQVGKNSTNKSHFE
ncbi:unnamed protein product, partial [Prorocentrum cordatum]